MNLGLYKYKEKFNDFDLRKALKNKRIYENTFYNTYNNKYYVYCHYSNGTHYSVFHIQIISLSELKNLTFPDLSGSKVYAFHRRLFF